LAAQSAPPLASRRDLTEPHVILRRLALFVVAFLLLWPVRPAPSAAAPAPAPAAAAASPHALQPADLAVLAEGRQTIGRLQNQAALATHDIQFAAIQKQAAEVEAQAQAVLRKATLRDAEIATQLRKLRPRRRGRASEADRAASAALVREKVSVEAAARQAQTVAAAASGVYGAIAQKQRESFAGRYLKQAQSPLFPGFWSGLAGSMQLDLARLGAFFGRLQETALNADQPKGLIGLAAGLLAAFGLAFPARRFLERFGRRKSGESVHPGFARTAAAVWIVAVDTALPTLAALALRVAAQWSGLLSDEADVLAGAAVLAVAWASATMALGRVLATDADPSQHLLPVSADTGRRLRAPIAAMALVTAGGLLLNRLNAVVGASVAAAIATYCVIALAYVLVAGVVLLSISVRRREADEAGQQERSPVWTLISLALAAVIVITVGALLAGYTTLAALAAGQIFWLSVIASSTYLLLRFVDDFCSASFRARGWAARMLRGLFNLRRSTIEQIGVLLASAVELLLLIAAFRLALTPFRQGGARLFTQFGQLDQKIRIGSVALSPGAVAAGVATLAIGLLLVRGVRAWMVRRFLPVTEWDVGLRNSVTTGVVYLGAGLALLSALAAMGLGFQQIALVASALSVGIGFGLQQIVQNFVSGIIVLIERPVKVGDWINVAGVDGDVRRIRVRATEIQTSDKAVVIVPNSDLITKPVTNRTHGADAARVELKLAIADAQKAERAKALILEIVKSKPRVLKTPEPAVLIGSLAAGGVVNFDAYVYVESAREASRVRSEIYFDILGAFKREEIAIA
jgi:small-conductance mechanosensitive channel